MSWMLILVAVIAALLLIYVFYPSIKKMFSNKPSGSKNRDVKSERVKRKEIRKAERLENRKSKAEAKTEKRSEKSNVEIIENKGDFFAEDTSYKNEEDPDTKVNYDNFDLGGFFEDERNVENPRKEEVIDNSNNVYSDNFEELFENDFSVFDDFKPSTNRSALSDFLGKGRGVFASESDDEMADLLNQNNIVFSEENEIKKQLDSLSPEMKILFLSNLLDKKDN